MPNIRVLLADDHAIVREGLCALLSHFDDIEVVGQAQDGQEAVARTVAQQPDVVIMDIVMPGMNGLEATRQIRQQCPHTRVIVLTQHDDRQFVLSFLQAGASGYVLKQALGTDLVNAVRLIASGGMTLDPRISATVIGQIRHPRGDGAPAIESLTRREREILSYIAHGMSNVQIAAKLSVSVNTIVTHRANLMSKLMIHKATDLVRFALENGLVDDSDPKLVG
jgi:two-component system, NarL family, response regulator NreC